MFISKKKEPLMRVELMTPSLPRMYSTTELQRLFFAKKERFSHRRNKVRKNTLFFNITISCAIFFIFLVIY